MYMTFTTLALFIAALVMIKKDYKTESTCWLAGFLFSTGLGSFSVMLEENYFVTQLSKESMNLIHFINAILSTTSHYMAPYCILLYSISCSDIIKNNKKMIYGILFIPVILSFIYLPIKSNYLRTPEEVVHHIRILSTWSVPYLFTAVYLIIYSYNKEKSRLMKRYKSLNLVIILPCIIYLILFNFIFRDFGIDNNWKAFAILIPIHFLTFLYFANRYGVLGVRLKVDRYKFAFDNVIEFISDSFIILDEKLNIIEVNKTFLNSFCVSNKVYKNFYDIIEKSSIRKYKKELLDVIEQSKKCSKVLEILVNIENRNNYFEIQVNAVKIKDEYFGSVLLFKDITEHKKNLELIKQNQIQLIEKERLLSLSQLIGGVAHNLKTPLMSVSGGIEIIKKDAEKIYEYIKSNNSETDEVKKAINEIREWQFRSNEYLIYMTDIINAIKGQLREVNEVENDFSIEEIINRILLLMSFEIQKKKCKINKKININQRKKIRGDINSLIQVLNNLITNAIEASPEGNEVNLGVYEEDKNVIFYVKNFGKEIPTNIQKKLFQQMVTTKGKNGTGLGLYIAKSLVKGRLNGEIYFYSNNIETSFFVKIPLMKEDEEQHG
ncbi:ATP-binding protein [Clostridium thailandense]|nr:PAS domain-containing sensor histidine kinase [Clostridium thailandense]